MRGSLTFTCSLVPTTTELTKVNGIAAETITQRARKHNEIPCPAKISLLQTGSPDLQIMDGSCCVHCYCITTMRWQRCARSSFGRQNAIASGGTWSLYQGGLIQVKFTLRNKPIICIYKPVMIRHRFGEGDSTMKIVNGSMDAPGVPGNVAAADVNRDSARMTTGTQAADKILLPHPSRFFEVRFESIGGLGAHAAGQVLATAAVLRMGLNGAHFSSYGSEKKGSLVRSFVRLGPDDRPIRTSAPVENPDAIVVFHSALLQNPATLAGLRSDGVLIYNSPPGPVPDQLSALPRTARVIRVDALGIAVKEASRPNAVLLGTLCGAFPFLRRETVLEALSEEFAGRHPEAVASNERAFRRGATEFEVIEGVGRAEGDLAPVRSEPVWGYETQPVGGMLPEPGNTAWNNLSTSRTGWLPVLNREKCIQCGVCDLVCPDYCLVWGEGDDGSKYERELMGIDYHYCKGCLRCVESCPTKALTKEAETPALADELRVPLFPDIIG